MTFWLPLAPVCCSVLHFWFVILNRFDWRWRCKSKLRIKWWNKLTEYAFLRKGRRIVSYNIIENGFHWKGNEARYPACWFNNHKNIRMCCILSIQTSKNRFQASLQGILYWMFVSKTFNTKVCFQAVCSLYEVNGLLNEQLQLLPRVQFMSSAREEHI